MVRKLALLFVLLLALPLLWSAKAQPGKAKGKGKSKERVVVVEHRGFLPHHRTVIVEYYGRRDFVRPADLPPGLAKQLRRNGRLPPGLEKKLVVFPPDLDTRLPVVAPGYQRGFIGHFALVWNPQTRVIVDIVAMR